MGVGLVFMLGSLVMIQEARHRCDGGVKSGRSSWVVLHKVTVGAATFLGFAGPPDRSPTRHLDDRAGDELRSTRGDPLSPKTRRRVRAVVWGRRPSGGPDVGESVLESQ